MISKGGNASRYISKTGNLREIECRQYIRREGIIHEDGPLLLPTNERRGLVFVISLIVF